MSQGRSKSSRELFKDVRVNAVYFLVFRNVGWAVVQVSRA